jgi:hypothetical protein
MTVYQRLRKAGVSQTRAEWARSLSERAKAA